MKIAPYLFFPGNCEEAFTAYEKILGGKIIAMMNHKGTPAESQVAPDWVPKIMHACLQLEGGQMLMASDAPPDRSEGPMQSVSVSVTVKETAEAERIFAALSDGARIKMPLEETFWAPRFGMLQDRFGTHWMISSAPAEACVAA
ncbi:VOC family protein [Bosea psychrotolerans]|uniref:PhnB protein n=1 Tax=Bosea psychrotolerans TaxID=1871628 RepID=A0A2S4M752_9HYPH|nr:VOC family protein [Bosea psychrotolerans]POR50429.1 PhnB protein [Bosea psychrotolerans]